MRKIKHTVVMTLLIIAVLILGYSFVTFMSGHFWLSVLFVFCMVGVFAIEKEA